MPILHREGGLIGYVSGGAICETIDKAATEYHGLATVGGTVNDYDYAFADAQHGGIAGLTLGGGCGYLSPSHGIALDDVLKATVVLADGPVVKTENTDLCWGIRDGGSNSGVVSDLGFY
ncbi:uncharacterized protein B0H18DRAFT_1116389 [Fomitopsis serialis]|uniref:uncharacterized protein n=1 Tax=Fomitopsis serialis TaxID=139415 RepID=UPI00200799F8|nr:uncharacterized protein B0H18DRAFT_1116389 [Neoantrodia serialis]KAH9931223.1 hypothetical protein B0H18DRAFT_1116389 [Neoantrodia serialis]